MLYAYSVSCVASPGGRAGVVTAFATVAGMLSTSAGASAAQPLQGGTAAASVAKPYSSTATQYSYIVSPHPDDEFSAWVACPE